jgi:hypothetical protein
MVRSGNGWPIWLPGGLLLASVTTADGSPLDLRPLIAVLDGPRVEYPVCGGAAATAYGTERQSEDADCVVRRDLSRLAAAMRELLVDPMAAYLNRRDLADALGNAVQQLRKAQAQTSGSVQSVRSAP